MDDIAKVRKALGLTQQGVADKATVTRSVIGEIEGRRKGLSVAASLKAAPVLGIAPGVLYLGTQLMAIKSKVDEEVITEEQGADKLLRVLRTVLDKFEGIEDEAEADELITQLEELLEEYTGNAVAAARGTKPTATAVKNHPTIYGAFKAQMDKSGTTQVRAEDYHVDDGRDFYGVKLSAARLRDEQEHKFEDISSFGTANVPADDDYDDLEGRDAFGRAIRTGR